MGSWGGGGDFGDGEGVKVVARRLATVAEVTRWPQRLAGALGAAVGGDLGSGWSGEVDMGPPWDGGDPLVGPFGVAEEFGDVKMEIGDA